MPVTAIQHGAAIGLTRDSGRLTPAVLFTATPHGTVPGLARDDGGMHRQALLHSCIIAPAHRHSRSPYASRLAKPAALKIDVSRPNPMLPHGSGRDNTRATREATDQGRRGWIWAPPAQVESRSTNSLDRCQRSMGRGLALSTVGSRPWMHTTWPPQSPAAGLAAPSCHAHMGRESAMSL